MGSFVQTDKPELIKQRNQTLNSKYGNFGDQRSECLDRDLPRRVQAPSDVHHGDEANVDFLIHVFKTENKSRRCEHQ